jgi:threo-3-hydroxy-L-aspartate ammonia-lyase
VADLVSLDEIRAAAERLLGVTVRTPLLAFSGAVLPGAAAAGAAADGAAAAGGSPALLIKPESLQPTGAFKLRGAYNAIATLAGPPGVVAHSSGNHGFAVAYAAALLGIHAAIVVPDNAPRVKTDLISGAGAEIVRVAPTLAARVEESRRIARDRGYAEIPPFDDRRVIAGQGTIGLEIAEDLAGPRSPAAVLVPVGGGGMISGVAVAVKALLPGTRVVGVEPELAADARESLRAGKRVAWAPSDTARTRADALRVEQVGELTFPHMQAFVDDIVTVSEAEIVAAVRRLAHAGRLVAEPGGAVAVAAALFRDPTELGLSSGGTAAPVVAVLSGGNIDPTQLAEILRD